jgi:hypothetical protein
MTTEDTESAIKKIIIREADKNQHLIRLIQQNCKKELAEIINVESINAITSVICARLEDFMPEDSALKVSSDLALEIGFHLNDVMTSAQNNIEESLQQMVQHFPAQISRTLTLIQDGKRVLPPLTPVKSRRK